MNYYRGLRVRKVETRLICLSCYMYIAAFYRNYKKVIFTRINISPQLTFV